MIDRVRQTLAMDGHTATERLVYLQLRVRGWLTAAEIGERVGISRRGASNALNALKDSGWVTSRTAETDSRGRPPKEWQSLIACEYCGERFSPHGIGSHESACDEAGFDAYDIGDMDPEDLGMDSETPEPQGGLR